MKRSKGHRTIRTYKTDKERLRLLAIYKKAQKSEPRIPQQQDWSVENG